MTQVHHGLDATALAISNGRDAQEIERCLVDAEEAQAEVIAAIAPS